MPEAASASSFNLLNLMAAGESATPLSPAVSL
jgi:hypothetical protein